MRSWRFKRIEILGREERIAWGGHWPSTNTLSLRASFLPGVVSALVWITIFVRCRTPDIMTSVMSHMSGALHLTKMAIQLTES